MEQLSNSEQGSKIKDRKGIPLTTEIPIADKPCPEKSALIDRILKKTENEQKRRAG